MNKDKQMINSREDVDGWVNKDEREDFSDNIHNAIILDRRILLQKDDMKAPVLGQNSLLLTLHVFQLRAPYTSNRTPHTGRHVQSR